MEPVAPAVEQPRPPVYSPNRVKPEASITVHLDIEGEQPRTFGWSSDKPKVPISASVTFSNPQPARPTGWTVGSFKVTGAAVRKDGSLSLTHSTHHLWSEERQEPWAQAIEAAARGRLEELLGSCTCQWAPESDGESAYLAEWDKGCVRHGELASAVAGDRLYQELVEKLAPLLFPDQGGPFDEPPLLEKLVELAQADMIWRGDIARGGPVEQYDNPATGDAAQEYGDHLDDVDLATLDEAAGGSGLSYQQQVSRLIEHTREVAARVHEVAEGLSGLSIGDEYRDQLTAIAAWLRRGPES